MKRKECLIGILIFLALCSIQGKADIFDAEPVDQRVPRDSKADVIFECRAGDELTDPVYSWFKDDTELKIEGRFHLYSGNLYITSPQGSDEGTYRCVITCEEGEAASNEAKLIFQYLEAVEKGTKKSPVTSAGVGVMFECGNFNYNPEYSVYFMWENPDNLERIKPSGSSTHMVSQKTGNLYLANPRLSDVRTLTCQARSRWKLNAQTVEAYANSASLSVDDSKVEYEPKFMIKPSDITYARLHGETYIECFATGNPTPEITWTKDGGELPNSAEISDAGQLYFQNVPEEAEGTYTCTVSNSKGSLSASGQLELQYAPLWTKKIQSKSLDRTNTLKWECSAKAAPVATYSWYYNGEELTNKNKSVTIEHTEDLSTLTITNLQDVNKGLYQCIALNKFGEAVSSAKLEVKSYPPVIKPELPPVINGALGEEVMIECPHTAAPAANVTWTKDYGDALEEGNKYLFGHNGTLVINVLIKEDEGTYTCKLSNMLGEDESSGTLKTYEPTIITTPPTNVSKLAGETGVLTCEASWDYRLTIAWSWYYADSLITDNYGKEYIMQGGQITIKSASSKVSGKYTCCAETSVGKPCASAFLLVTAPPNPPMDLAASAPTETSHDLRWTKPFDNHSPITHYTVELKNSYDEDWMTADTEPAVVETPECKVINLLPYNDYTYRVYATNDIGDGEPSEQSNMYQTTPGAPVRAPHRLRGGGGEIGQLVIQWKPLSEEYYGADKVTYVLAIQKIPKGEGVTLPLPPPLPGQNQTTDENSVIDMSEENWDMITINDGKNSNITFGVGDDEVYAPYNVRIRADNIWGEGPWSRIKIAYSFEIKPDMEPTKVRTQSPPQAYQADIIWDTLISKNGRVTGYKVKIEPLAAAPEDTAQILETKARIPYIRAKKLSANAVYNVYVAAFNGAGQGPWSKPLVITTAKKPPSKAPRSVKIHVKDLVLTAEWDPISYAPGEKMDEAILAGYKVQYWHSNMSSKTAVTRKTEKTKLSFSIANNSLFNAVVRGYSAGGDGTPSQIYYISTQSVALPGYIHCCGANTITSSSLIVVMVTAMWALFQRLEF